MQKENNIDFTTGSIPKHLIEFSAPLFLGNLLQTFYNTVDTIWVGKFLGRNALAAVSVSFPIIFIIVSLATGITLATTVLVGQYKGANDENMIIKTSNNSLILLAIISVILTFVGLFLHKSILNWMNTPEELMEMAAGYLNIIFLGLIFTFEYNAISGVLRGLGDSRTPLLFLFYTTVLNIVLDPIFIFGIGPVPKMGINGAALATVLAQAISVYLAVRHLNKNGHIFSIKIKELKLDLNLTKDIIRIGLPAGLQQTVVALGQTVVMTLVNSFGATVVAAYGAASKIDSLSLLPSMSIGFATSSLAAQNIGAKKYDRVRDVMKWSSILSVSISILTIILVYVFPRPLLMLFTNDNQIIENGTIILKIFGLAYIPFGLMWVFNGIIRGAGDTLITMFFSIFSLWLVRLPLAYYLSKHTPLGSNGIWTAISISMTLSCLISMLYYKSGRWKKSIVNSIVDEQ